MKTLNRVLLSVAWGTFFIWGVISINRPSWLVAYVVMMLFIAWFIIAIDNAPEMPEDYDKPKYYDDET